MKTRTCSYCQQSIPEYATKCPSCGGGFQGENAINSPAVVVSTKKDKAPKAPRTTRSFAHLHQDAWRCALKHPFYFFILPAILYYPFDLLAEFLTVKMAAGFAQELKIYYRTGQLADFLVGTYLFGVHLEILRLMAEGQPVEKGVLKKGFTYFGRILGASFAAGVRAGLYFLLLIVPGIIKVIHFALLGPLIVLGGWEGRPAVARSEIMMKGHTGRFFRYACGWIMIYWTGWFALCAFYPQKASPFISAFFNTPYNMITSLWTIGLCLFYVDLVPEKKGDYRRPVRALDPVGIDHDPVTDKPSRKSAAIAVGLSVALVVGAVIYSASAPYFDGDVYTFGAQEHALYYDPSINAEEVKAIAQTCQSVAIFQGDWSFVMLLEQNSDRYRLNVVESKDYWNEPELRQGMKELDLALSTQSFSRLVDVTLYDDFDDQREVIVHELRVAGDVNSQFVPIESNAGKGGLKEWY